MFIFSHALLFAYLVLPTSKPSKIGRYGVYFANLTAQVWLIVHARSPHAVVGPTIGFYCGWNILWTANLLVFNDARQQFKKARRLSIDKYTWQAFPTDSFIDRLAWVLDLFFNSKGMGWSWKVTGEPSRPLAVEASLQQISVAEAVKHDVPATKSGRIRHENRRQAITYQLWTIAKAYVWLDALKTIINHDAYFWGIDDALPPSYLPDLIAASPILVSLYRTLTGMFFVVQAIKFTFGIPQALLLLIFTPDMIGANAEPWMYPAHFGNYSTVYKRGLAGFWGDYWHRLAKESMQSSSRALAKAMSLRPKSLQATGVELIATFTLSGLLHAALSIAMIGPTQPFREMYLSFVLQPLGILVEITLSQYLARKQLGKVVPDWSASVSHFLYTHAWLGLTMRLVVYDLSRGGFLLYEPVPYSIFRGLGLGGPGDGVLCWSANAYA